MVFDAVRTTRGVYLFDEIDALAAARGAENDVGEARRILNSFLQFLDEDTGPSIVVATTNLPQFSIAPSCGASIWFCNTRCRPALRSRRQCDAGWVGSTFAR